MDLFNLEEYREPQINVIGIDQFQERVQSVFKTVANVLSNTYGPYGSNSIIGVYPQHYLTKDGYQLTKYLAFNMENGPIDDMILKLIVSNSNRVNNTVGDGTTTAIIATDAIYDNYLMTKKEGNTPLSDKTILPRNIVDNIKKCGEELIRRIKEKKMNIDSLPLDEKLEVIRNVAYISSNGSEEITEKIVDIYRNIDTPIVNVDLSKTSESYTEYGSGCTMKIHMGDPCYVNNDNNTCKLEDVDILMFSHKVHEGSLAIINEVLNESIKRDRKLLVIAPMYDNRSIQTMRMNIMNAIAKYGYTPLILASAETDAGVYGEMYQDLSVVLHTRLITRKIEDDMITELKAGKPIVNLINIDGRDYIKDLIVLSGGTNKIKNTAISENDFVIKPENPMIDLGYCDSVELGEKQSFFNGFYYDEVILNTLRQNVKHLYETALQESKTTDGFSIKAVGYRRRLAMINMKSVTYYVGGETSISQEMNKDVVDDAVKAVDSAIRHGIVKGCNITTLSILTDMVNGITNPVEKAIAEIFFNGFKDVARTVFRNAGYENYTLSDAEELLDEKTFKELDTDNADLMVDAIINTCIKHDLVFDLESKTFTDTVINSANTDIEIVRVVTDLLTLLISGNQLIVSMR